MEQRLFNKASNAPLAECLRPATLNDFVGQLHLVGEGTALRNGPLHSCMLWGPPGCGKTTLARLLAKREQAAWEAISTVSAGVADLRKCIAAAQNRRDEHGSTTVIFVDEAHRFNKAQQDHFLPHIESGLLTFIGATTENPAFEINAALLSRLTVYRLEPLSDDDLHLLLCRAQQQNQLEVTPAAAAQLVSAADGDARRLFNLLELLANAGKPIDEQLVAALDMARLRRFDKRGDVFYDQISALIKTMRGSDPDAALYWLCRLLDGGADPLYISRRMIRAASEDIGMADPRALEVTLRADEQYRKLGTPEGELGLAMAVVYLACAPKSNAVYVAFAQVMAKVQAGRSEPVPKHLRNAPTKLAKAQGHSDGYRYTHDEAHGYAAGVSYLPDGMAPLRVYAPTNRGFEERVRRRLEFLRGLDAKRGK